MDETSMPLLFLCVLRGAVELVGRFRNLVQLEVADFRLSRIPHSLTASRVCLVSGNSCVTRV